MRTLPKLKSLLNTIIITTITIYTRVTRAARIVTFNNNNNNNNDKKTYFPLIRPRYS